MGMSGSVRGLCAGKTFPKDLLQETETGEGGEVEERQEEMVVREKKMKNEVNEFLRTTSVIHLNPAHYHRSNATTSELLGQSIDA